MARRPYCGSAHELFAYSWGRTARAKLAIHLLLAFVFGSLMATKRHPLCSRGDSLASFGRAIMLNPVRWAKQYVPDFEGVATLLLLSVFPVPPPWERDLRAIFCLDGCWMRDDLR